MKMRTLTSVAALAALSGLASTASAEVDWNLNHFTMNMDQDVVGTYDLGVPNPINVTLTMTNFTGTSWNAIDFEILPSAFEAYDPGEFEVIVFDEDAPRGSTLSPVIIDQPTPKLLKMKFPAMNFEPGDTHTFDFVILNPNIQLFDLAIRPSIPTPGSVALAGMACLGFVPRRRRSN